MNADLKAIAKELRDGGVRCNCDLDTFVPEPATGHTFVCRIHNRAIAIAKGGAVKVYPGYK